MRYTDPVAGGESGSPQVLVPYPGPQGDGEVQDIFVYLRPETNGVLVESLLLKVIQSCSQYHTGINLVYLANLPGEFILENHIVERHYAYKLYFAVYGGRAFTARMRATFESRFAVGFDSARVIGSFEALRQLGMSPDQLFSRWVDAADVLHVNGQTVKRIDTVFVVNYDIPALLHKNNRGTDIAVMLFRCAVDYSYFGDLVNEMRTTLVDSGVLPKNLPASRAFHFSHGPFEQLLDARGHLRATDGSPVPFSDLSFVRFALAQGVSEADLRSAVDNPICLFAEDGDYVEESIFVYTATDSYAQALEKLARIRAQYWIREY